MSGNSKKDYNKITKAMVTLMESDQTLDAKRVYRISFWRGIFFGFGIFLGGTLLVTLLLYVLSVFQEVPFIGDIAESVSESIDSIAE